MVLLNYVMKMSTQYNKKPDISAMYDTVIYNHRYMFSSGD